MSDDLPIYHPPGEALAEAKPKLKKPSLYRVVLLNDDYTSMDFVVQVLQKFFQKSEDEATQIMWQVHQKGQGVCGFYPFEIAETKVNQVIKYARGYEYPLQCTMEEA